MGSAAHGAPLQPYLVKDINPLLVPADSDPADFRSLGPVVLFTADDGSTGRELWRSDGTTGGTFRLTDACAGECSSAPLSLGVGDGRYFFAPYTQEFAGRELWVSDGTAANTRSLTSPRVFIRGGRWLPNIHKLLFFAADGVHGEQPWISDGTAAGTFALADQDPGDVEVRVPFGTGALFASYAGSLWFTDGTIAGTRKVRTWQGTSCIHNLGVVNASVNKPRALFLACTAKGTGLWTTDGTAAGTKSILELQDPPGTVSVFRVIGSRYFFNTTKSSKQGEELWVSDGTAKGTKALTSLKPAHPLAPYVDTFNNLFVFFVDDGIHGRELWTSDGTPKGTRAVADVCPGGCDGASVQVGSVGNRLYFNGNDGTSGWELWSTDGKASGTRRVADLCAGSCSSYPIGIAAVGGREIVRARDEAGGEHLWSTDGTAAGTTQLGSFVAFAHPYSTILANAPLGNRLAFAAKQEADGMELWITDGTPAGTTEVADIAPATPDSGGAGLMGAAGDKMVFLAGDGLHDTSGLWCSDGSEAGTSLVRWLEPGEGDFPPLAHATLGNSLLYAWRDSHGSQGLWRTDCTDGGTLRLTPEGIRPVPEGPSPMVTAGGKVFFFARNPEFETTLWASDGTPGGTHAVTDLRAMGVYVDVGGFELVALGSKVYFCASENNSGDELWSSDGTAAGTALAVDLVPGFESVRPHGFAAGQGGFFFSGFGLASSSSLWFSNGTPAGTVLLSENLGGRVVPTGNGALVFAGDGIWKTDGTPSGTTRFLAATNWRIDEAVASGNRVIFTGPSCDAPSCPDFDPVLFESDGTAAGTRRLRDPDGNLVVAPASLAPFAGEVVFFARRGADGYLWQTDGGIARPLQPVRSYQFGDRILGAGARLFFKGDDSTHGQELWAVRPQ